jgi:hypothetical protein
MTIAEQRAEQWRSMLSASAARVRQHYETRLEEARARMRRAQEMQHHDSAHFTNRRRNGNAIEDLMID